MWALIAAVWCAAGLMWWLIPPSNDLGLGRWSQPEAFLLLAGLFSLTEIFVVHVQFRRDSHTFSLVEVPLVAGLVFAPPGIVVLALIVGGTFTLGLHRHQPVIKLCFNVGAYACTATVAAVIFFRLVPEGAALDSSVMLAVSVAAMSEAVLAIVLVFVAISISEGTLRLSELARCLRFGLVTAAFSTGLGLTAALLLDTRPGAVWLVFVPAAGVHLASWAYTSERRRHEDLEFLYKSTRLLHQSPELDATVIDLLAQAREAFRCDVAEILLHPSSTDPIERAVVGPGDHLQRFGLVPRPDDKSTAWFEQVVLRGGPMLVDVSTTSAPICAYLEEREIREAIVAPLTRDGRVVGVITLADPQSEVTGFDNEDLRLVETLANHVSVALENGHLEQSVERLRLLERRLHHQAHHDSLTGLANRVMFSEQVAQELLEAADGAQVAVLFIDLDDFKTVNDTLGHAAGDDLLVEAASRITSCLRDGDVAARLGGDEFAILLTGPSAAAGAKATAGRIVDELRRPVTIGFQELPVHASVGVAIGNKGDDGSELLRNADTAMYTAKARGKRRVEVYDTAMHDAIVSRYSATFEIQRAIDEDQFVVLFQPLVDLATRTIRGAEALVRWQHPTRGLLSPEDFISVAEECDAILAIDQLVLRKSCEWLNHRDSVSKDEELIVTVNLAARELLHPDLPELISATLGSYDIIPARVGIEITESLAMQDLKAAVDMLARLEAIGVSIALDDFGTGYSSLSQLRDLAVDTVKIAKPFIDGLSVSEEQAAFVHAIIKLAQILGKHVVAEGIERPEQAEMLTRLGCDTGQGYYFARPLDEHAFDVWLHNWTGLVRRGADRDNVLSFPAPGPEAGVSGQSVH